ncbi:glycoside hydrolase superfamily [Panaeolus papilionaceus]|nr:glycoside hydrolase superfamily [Panaeolus papilionaceus]
MDSGPASPRLGSPAQPSPHESSQLLTTKNEGPVEEGGTVGQEPEKKSRRWGLILAVLAAALIVIILVVVLPVYFTVIKPNKETSSSSSPGPSSPQPTGGSDPTPDPPSAPTRGGDGSTVKFTNGTLYTYTNTFGGIWVDDPDNPYDDSAYPNSWTPPLNQSWNYETDRMFGVNLGGWFVLEPFISPEIFQRYGSVRDEWTLCERMRADPANGGINQMEEHYKTFITEEDIAQIAAAGLNWVRLPVPYWAIDKYDNEPFLEKTSWNYIVQALQWCRKYGLRVKLDLHTIPGSQNGWNHSGKLGQINFLRGTMGMANAQRALNYIRIFTQFISQPEWKNVVPVFGIMNEPRVGDLGSTQLPYRIIREITGTGEGNGPWISFHDGFTALSGWDDFLNPGADRIIIDQHPYLAFSGSSAMDPVDTGTGPDAGGIWPETACNRWARNFNASRNARGPVLAGEWSNGINDCGLFLVPPGQTTYGGNCATDFEDASLWSAGKKAGLMRYTMASMDAFRDWFFWTWKIGDSIQGRVETPLWSYKLGLEGGWMPRDPRAAIGTCGRASTPFNGFQPWVTGGVGAGTLPAAQTAAYAWPPTDINAAIAPVAQLPMYTPTGVINTLPVPTYTDSKGNAIVRGNGWANPRDTVPAPTPVAGCTYPDGWDALSAAPPPCAVGILAEKPQITPPP